MSLFDHFTETAANKSRSSSVASSILEEHITHQTSDAAAGSSRAAFPSFSASNPIFSLDKVQFNFPGSIVDFKVENNILAVACASLASGKGILLWIDLDKPNSIVEIPITGNGAVEAIYLSPLAQGVIISLVSGENYFYYPPSVVTSASSTSTPSSVTTLLAVGGGGALSKPKILSKIKGRIGAVAWPAASLKGSILVGTRGGAVFDLEVSSTDSKKFEKSCVQVFAGQEAIFGLYYSYMPCGLVVYLSTTTLLYQFIGPRDTASAGSLLIDPSTADIQEIPGEKTRSTLSLYTPQSSLSQPPTSLAWLTAPGIYTGTVQSSSKAPFRQAGDSTLDNVVIAPYPVRIGLEISPITMAVSEYHYLFLTPEGECVIVNKLDNQIQYTLAIPSNLSSSVPINQSNASERAVTLVGDRMRKTFWVCTNEALYEIIVSEEDRDIWKIYFERGQYKEAINIAKSVEAKAFIAEKYADQCLKKQEYNLAAELYARTKLGIEEISLRFLRLKLDTSKPLLTFLTRRMALFREVEDSSQTIMIGSWILELLLSDLDFIKDKSQLLQAEQTGDGKTSSPLSKEISGILDSIKSLMKTYKNRLHTPTVYSLLRQHGQQELQLQYAELIGDHSRICDIHIANQEWHKALEVIGTQATPNLLYKHSPLLILHIPEELVVLWKRCGTSFLNPRLLLPAMLRYDMQNREKKVEPQVSPGSGKNQIVSFLEHVVKETQCTDRVIHNYLFYLYVTTLRQPGKEQVVIEFIKSQSSLGFGGIAKSLVHFDVQYALRLCQQHHLLQACVQLYLLLEMQEEALSLALKSNDLDLAKGIVEMVDGEEEEIRKQLWLQMAKHVITENKDYKKAMVLSKEGGLKIEQVLQFFPDFVQISQVKDELVEALTTYKSRLAELSRELDESANTTDLIRLDIKALKSRSVVVPILKRCDECYRPLTTRQFHVFPCHHAFHSDCIVTQLLQYPVKSPRVKYLQNQLAETGKAKEDLERLIGEECILCGDILIRTVDIPLVENIDVL